MNKRAFSLYVSTSQLQELKMVLTEGGRWHTTIPDHPDSLSPGVIDFCPGITGLKGTYSEITLKYLNSFPPREKLRRGGKIRIQFNNEQRRRILSGKYTKE